MSTRARPASTICLLRDGDAGLEVLMVRRSETARFMAGAWVFPGGAVDDIDRAAGPFLTAEESPAVEWEAAGLRELAEEVRIWLTDGPFSAPDGHIRGPEVYARLSAAGRRFDASRLAYFANWITPTMIPVRFDTRFFAVVADPEAEADPDLDELDRAEWVTPDAAVALGGSGRRTIPFPTMKVLEFLSGFSTAAAVVEFAHGLPSVAPVLPRARVDENGELEIALPGDPGFDEMADPSPDDAALSRAVRAAEGRRPGGESADEG